MRSTDPAPTMTTLDALKAQSNVMRAVMLRDLRTRFFDHGLGFLLVPLWPLAHLMVVAFMFSLLGRPAPFGDSAYVFFATGLLPTVTFMYVSRFMSMSLLTNKPMLAFPAVRIMDILLARGALEIIGSIMSVALVVFMFLAVGEDPVPRDPFGAVYAMMMIMVLSVGMGMIVGVASLLFPFAATFYALFLILIYLLSGTLFVASTLPEPIIAVLQWNPVLHGTEWLRTTFYEGYPDAVLSKSYLAAFAVGTVFVGLLMERLLRPRLLSG